MNTGRVFVDSNIFVYALDDTDPIKRARARDTLTQLVDRGIGAISTQVVVEFGSALLRMGYESELIAAGTKYLDGFDLIPVTPAVLCVALKLRNESSISYWDSLIVAAAQVAGCQLLLSEDLSHDQNYGSVRVQNSFLAAASG